MMVRIVIRMIWIVRIDRRVTKYAKIVIRKVRIYPRMVIIMTRIVRIATRISGWSTRKSIGWSKLSP